MRVVFLTHYYPPEVGAPQTRIAALARGLARRGVEVAVHTCFPHYPSGEIPDPYRMRPAVRERVDGVPVLRTAGWVAANRGVVGRLTDHVTHAVGMAAAAPVAGRADVVVVESPPLFTAGAAIPYARVKRAALVVNVADRWPESAVQLGALASRRVVRAAEWLERTTYQAAARITVPTLGLASDLAAVPQARGKVAHMPPAVDLERFTVAEPQGDGALRVVYVGTVGMAHGLKTLVDAARIAGPDVVRVTIAGDGAEARAVEADASHAQNVAMLGPIPSEQVPALYARADAAVVLLRDKPLFTAALPTKLLEAFAAGRPVIVSARGEAAELVEATGAGIAVPPETPEALADAILRLASDRESAARMGRAGRELAEQRFGRQQSVDRWLELLKTITPR